MNMITSLEKKNPNKQVRFAYRCVYKVYFCFTPSRPRVRRTAI